MPPRSTQQQILDKLSTISTDVALVKQEQTRMSQTLEEMKPKIELVNSLNQEVRGVNGNNGLAGDNKRNKTEIKALWRNIWLFTGALALATSAVFLKWVGFI